MGKKAVAEIYSRSTHRKNIYIYINTYALTRYKIFVHTVSLAYVLFHRVIIMLDMKQ